MRRPIMTVAVVVLVIGLATAAALLLLPINRDSGPCGSVMFNQDPNIFLGQADCVYALSTRRAQAVVVAFITLAAAGAFAFIGSAARTAPNKIEV